MLALSGLRANCGYKVFTTLLHQQRFKSSKTVKSNPKGLPSCRHRPVECCGHIQPVSRLDIKNVKVSIGLPCHRHMIESFILKNYWTRDPVCTGLYMCNWPYIRELTWYYVATGDVYMATENTIWGPNLVGVCIAKKIGPKALFIVYKAGMMSRCSAEGIRLLFLADLLRKANTFNAYKLNWIYHVEVLATDSRVAGQGVGTLLLETVLSTAMIEKQPLLQVVATNIYAAKICQRLKMKEEVTTPYSVYTDIKEQPIFYLRRPQTQASVYTRECLKFLPHPKSEPKLYKTYADLLVRYKKNKKKKSKKKKKKSKKNKIIPKE